MMMMLRPLLFALATWTAASAQHPPMPAGTPHEEHQRQMQRDADLKTRGAAAMGFDQDETRHHFRLLATGGAIEVVVTDPADSATLDRVRTHLKQIADEFGRGEFGRPFATHGEIPPGVPTLSDRRKRVMYAYEDVPAGGRVRIATSDSKALAAVHAFLRYQIREHATGDSLAIAK